MTLITPAMMGVQSLLLVGYRPVLFIAIMTTTVRSNILVISARIDRSLQALLEGPGSLLYR